MLVDSYILVQYRAWRWPHAVRNMQLLYLNIDLHTNHSCIRPSYQLITWYPTQKREI